MNKSGIWIVSKGFWLLLLITMIGLVIGCGGDEKIERKEVLVEEIQVSGNYITDGGTSHMSVLVLPEDAPNKEVLWSVNNPGVATIDQTGLLTAIANGTVTVTATAQDESGVSGSRFIKVSGVYVEPTLVASITIVGGDITDGKLAHFTVNILPVEASNKSVSWSVSDASLAEINGSGTLTPLKNGSLKVIATALDGSGTIGELDITISGVTEQVVGTVVDNENDFLVALAAASPGDKIYLRGGTYKFSTTIRFSNQGQSGNVISVLAHPADENRPVLDFSAMSESSSNRGIILSGSYWFVKGIDVYKAGDNGMFMSGSNNKIEFCSFYENKDSGLQIGSGGANNTILNCDSYFNADASLENADGFAAKLDCGSGNTFIGCRAWNNLDDGWDGYLRGANNVTTSYENCWAIRNGYLKSGALGAGDGNGFKTGGSDTKDLKHNASYKNCIAAGNAQRGFDHNSNRGSITILNASSYGNGRNFSFGTTNPVEYLKIKNSLSFGGSSSDQYYGTTTDISNNSWENGLSATSADFVSTNIDLLLAPRKADGSLPDVNFLKLVQGSDMINAGVDVGLPFNGSAPDLGAFESDF